MKKALNFYIPGPAAVEYDRRSDCYHIDAEENGYYVAYRVRDENCGMRVPHLLITTIGNAYSGLKELSSADEMPEFDPAEIMARLIESLVYGRCNSSSRHEIWLHEIVRDIVYDATPVGVPDPEMVFKLHTSLRLIAAEIHAHLRNVGAYIHNTLVYKYVEQADPWHALLRRRTYAVFN